MNPFSIFYGSLFSVVFLTGCAVDSRWGPPKSGLREPMAWQYEGAFFQKAAHTAPVAILNTQLAPRATTVAQTTESTANKVTLYGNYAIAPPHAPPAVQRAVAAANRLQKFPYRRGGGHAKLNDTAYDCSGAVSYVLREAGLMTDQMPSSGFLKYGEDGPGEWITVWVKNGHVYMTIGDLRFDTGGFPRSNGPRWKPTERSTIGFLPRHPSRL
ncbi:MAG: hypothetical protein ACN4GG_00540 [Akkermansiaceae bacterium]